MSDFTRHVRDKLGFLPLTPEREAEIVEEIAGHIRVAFEAARRRGVGEDDALELAEQPFVPWDALREQIAESERTLGTEAARFERGIDDYLIAKKKGAGGRLAGLVADFWHDLRFAVRSFRRQPGFAIPAIVTLTLAIGATTAIFSLVNGILLTPLPYEDPERLVALQYEPVSATARQSWLGMDARSQNHYRYNVSYPSFESWCLSTADVFDGIAAYDDTWSYTVGFGDGSERLPGAWVSAGIFSLLGVEPVLGRAFAADEDTPGSTPVVILSHRLWQRKFAGSREVIGQVLPVGGEPHTIIGVLPAGFGFPGPEVEFWRTMADVTREYSSTNYEVVARLQPEITRKEADVLLAGRRETRPGREGVAEEWGCSVLPLRSYIVGDTSRLLLIFLAAALAVLLIAGVNVVNLMLSRATSSEQEYFVRSALGAGRRRLLRQQLAESLLVSVTSGLLGPGLAVFLTRFLIIFSPSSIPRLDLVGIDAGVLGFTFTASVVMGLTIGLLPALRTARANLAGGRHTGGLRLRPGSRHQRAFHGLVIVQICLALILLVAAGLFLKSFAGMLSVERGFDSRHVLTFETSPPRSQYPTFEDHVRYYDEMLAGLQNLPGVSSAAIAPYLPGTEWFHTGDFATPGYEPSPGEELVAEFKEVSPGYFAALGIGLLAGRLFDESVEVGERTVVVINEEMARRYWPDGDVVGSDLILSPGEDDERRVTVVGIVNDVRVRFGGRIRGDEEKLQIYVPFSVWGRRRSMDVLIRVEGDPVALVPAVRQVLAAIDPGVTVFDFTTLETLLSRRVATPRFRAFLIGAFGLVALILAVVGVYGVMAFAVARRTREMGIRKAIGAREGQIMQEVFRRGLVLTLFGLGVGLAGAWIVATLLESYLYELTAHDPVAFVLSTLVLTLSALLACLLPARRAARVDPVIALREE